MKRDVLRRLDEKLASLNKQKEKLERLASKMKSNLAQLENTQLEVAGEMDIVRSGMEKIKNGSAEALEMYARGMSLDRKTNVVQNAGESMGMESRKDATNTPTLASVYDDSLVESLDEKTLSDNLSGVSISSSAGTLTSGSSEASSASSATSSATQRASRSSSEVSEAVARKQLSLAPPSEVAIEVTGPRSKILGIPYTIDTLGEASKTFALRNGLKVIPSADFKIELTRLEHTQASQDQKPLLKVDVSYRNRVVASFLRGFFRNPEAMTKSIFMAASRHFTRSFKVRKIGGEYQLAAGVNLPQAWMPYSGDVVYNYRGASLTLGEMTRKQSGARAFTINAGSEPICPGSASSCYLTMKPVHEGTPILGWKNLALRIYGKKPAGNWQAYAGGYQVRKEGSVMNFWGPKNGSSNFTIVNGSKVILRSKIKTTSSSVATLSIAAPPIAINR